MQKMTKLTDEKLVTAYASGDNKAFDALLKRHQARVFTYIFNIVKNKDINTLVKVYEVVYAVVFQRGGVLAFEQAGCDVEHSATRIAFFYSDTYCLDEVGFPYTCRAENK